MQVELRTTISLKIFSIAVSLVLLMAVVTGLSTHNISRVSSGVNALSEFYVPLQAKLDNARVSVSSQVTVLERLLLARAVAREDKSDFADQEELFRTRGEEADKFVAEAIGLADVAIRSRTLEPEDRRLLERLRDKELPDVIAARQHLHSTTLSFLKEVDTSDRKAIKLFRRVVTDERNRLSKEVNDVVEVVSQLVQSAAAAANSEQQRALYLNWGITLVAGLLGLVLAAYITRTLVRPVHDLVDGTKAVEHGDLDVNIDVRSSDEIAQLTQSFNHMVGEIRQKRSITETFGKYLDPRIVKRLIDSHSLTLEGEMRVMTVFFSDIEGFTKLCEQLTPDAAVRCLNRYFSLASAPIRAADGIIDKYIGDAIMAFWGPPFTSEQAHAEFACRAALAQLGVVLELRALLPDLMGLRKGVPVINVRVGLATGEVTVGNIGSEFTKGYTVIGDTVNLASRLEGANKAYGTRLLMSDRTWELAKHCVEAREVDAIRVVGKTEPVTIYELLALKGELPAGIAQLCEEFEAGLAAYRRCDWDAAQARFQACLALKPDDGPSRVFATRVKHLAEHPPGLDWDRVWSLADK